ncbi:phage major capsid protein [Devosia sp. XJ19-1]|uniref:Phage major capsid protein n=1 Tax=Devosia ureilytica TaxID=2952754 RepID=A0A9Q4AP96_9HYPH|nr:phage major capsid protein [Devosia ureilytica]MCP8884255.1 phage major capsid protein [Devosia ureilytica]MCP8887863.1 phage major capsid protein [Devosia ureilytica]
MDRIDDGLETKAGAGGDIAALFAEFSSAFEEFKATNDQRLKDIEKRGSADGLLEDKLEKLNRVIDGHKAAMDRLSAERSRPAIEGKGGSVPDGEYKEAFAAYVKRGEEKALSIGVNADGGYVVPGEVETEITRLMTHISPIRAIAGVRQVSGSIYKRPITVTGPQTGWVGETASRPTTNSQTLAELSYPTTELYAMPAATSAFLDDAAVDVGQWIADEVNAAFAAQETTAFVTGDGSNKPTGFLNAPKAAEASWSWGNLGYLATGVSGALPASSASDILIDLVYALKAGYRQNASWVMNRKVQGALRKLKDADGNYLWQPAAAADGRASFMGFPLVEAEDMPNMSADSFSVAFGDFRRGYLIVDRQGVSVLRDPFSSKPYVLFYTTKRVGGGIADYDAIKLLKFGTS